MKLTIESTEQIVDLESGSARVWNGVTESGIKCAVLVYGVIVHIQDDNTQFEKELQEVESPLFPIDLSHIARKH